MMFMGRKRSNTSQRQMVLNHIQKYGGITSIEAIELYGATRLSGLIYNLKKDGYNINTQLLKGVTRYGTSCCYAKYSIR